VGSRHNGDLFPLWIVALDGSKYARTVSAASGLKAGAIDENRARFAPLATCKPSGKVAPSIRRDADFVRPAWFFGSLGLNFPSES
jgi:hypothetical protein